jgi:hypothetical protein
VHREAAETITAFNADFAENVRILEYDRPLPGTDEAVTAQSITLMQWLDDRDSESPAVFQAAWECAQTLPPNPSIERIADAAYQWAHQHVRYVHEQDMAAPFSHLDRFTYDQTLIAPAALLAMPEPIGDCPDFSMLVASILDVFGIQSYYKTIAADPNFPDLYSHVYIVVDTSQGRFHPLRHTWYPEDASNAPLAGVEFAKPFKAKIWPNKKKAGTL